jgi:hypothetical protein
VTEIPEGLLRWLVGAVDVVVAGPSGLSLAVDERAKHPFIDSGGHEMDTLLVAN